MMRAQDLRALLEDDASGAPDHPVPLAAIARRAATIRRRRYACGAALATIGIAAAVLVQSVVLRPPQPAGPAVGTLDGLPEYLSGGRLIDHAVFRGPARTSAPASFTLPSGDVFFTVTCTGHPSYQVRINGEVRISSAGDGDCGGRNSISWPSRDWQRSLHAFGIDPGRPTGVGLDFTATPTAQDTVTIGLYRIIPPEQFPLPPRPATVAPITTPVGSITLTAPITPVPADPNAVRTRRVTLTAQLSTMITCDAPGAVQLFADAHLVNEYSCWDYQQASADGGTIIEELRAQGVPARAGQQVTLTVRPSRFADAAWRVDVGTPTGEIDLPRRRNRTGAGRRSVPA